MSSFTRKGYAGNAEALALNANIGAGDSSLTSSVTPSASWPTGTGSKPFVIRVGLLTNGVFTNEEKMLVTTRTGASFGTITRGYDGTTGVTHAAGEVIEHDWDADSADDANACAVAFLGAITAKGDQIVGTGSKTTALKSVGSDGLVWTADSASTGGIKWAQVGVAGIATAVAGSGLTGGNGSALSVVVDAATITVSGNTLGVPSGGIGATQIAAGAVGTTQLANLGVTSGKIANGAVGATQLAATAVAAGAYGSATAVPSFTVDAQGRLTAAANVTITGTVPGGTAGGSNALAGTFPDPSLAAGAITGSTLAVSGGKLKIATSGVTLNELAAAVLATLIPTGLPLPWPSRVLPAQGGFLWADGVAVSRSTYAALFAVLCWSPGTFTVTLASPGVFTCTAHGLSIGDAVYATTTGALPTGLTANTIYYVMTVPTADTFTLGTTRSSTAVTTAVNTSVSQSGVHTLRACPWGLGDGSTTFNTPSFLGRTLSGLDAFGGGSDAGNLSWLNAIGLGAGEEKHTMTTAEMVAHLHTVQSNWSGGISTGIAAGADFTIDQTNENTSSVGSTTPFNVMQPTTLIPWIVKT